MSEPSARARQYETRWRTFATRQQHEIATRGFQETCDRAIVALKRLRDDVPDLAARLGDYERGWPSASPGMGEGGGAGVDGGAPAEALTFGVDVAMRIRELLLRTDEMLDLGLRCDGSRSRLMATALGRGNELETCSECQRPVQPVQRGKRLDGELLHLDSPGTDDHGEPLPVCFWARYNRVRERTTRDRKACNS